MKLSRLSIALICLLSSVQTLAASEADCRRLLDANLPDTRITSAMVQAENSFAPPGADSAMQHPSFCRVAGVTDPAVRFEVWLPLADWNGKYQGVGNGGMAGTISYGAMAGALRRGYATASTDTGHEAGPISFDASWASGRPDLIADFGHRSLHLTTRNGKALTEAFYAEAPAYSYYVGCSKGGQQGLMEAQRYPDDFDGLIAGNPANDWTRFYAGAHLWYSLAMLADEEAWIPPAKLPALGSAVNAACDAKDGTEDGILMNPLACDFQPRELLCPAGVDNDSCLSGKQVTAVEKIWSGVRDSSGELIYPGLAHCRGGPGPDSFDALTALENWVERGMAPEQIVASKIEQGEVVRSRPLCPHPEVAVYDGNGSTDAAENFSCRAPD